MGGWEYLERLHEGQRAENHRASVGLGTGGGGLIAGVIVCARDDSTRAFKWRNYERLLVRLYGSGLVVVAEDGTRTPWSPTQLGDGA